MIWRVLRRTDIPANKKPTGLIRGDDKRPYGLTLVTWQGGRCLTGDATIVDILVASYCTLVLQVRMQKHQRNVNPPDHILCTYILSQHTTANHGTAVFESSDGRRALSGFCLRWLQRKNISLSFLFQRVSFLTQTFNRRIPQDISSDNIIEGVAAVLSARNNCFHCEV